MIVIVDYGLGNLRSILKATKTISDKVIVSSQKKDIDNAKKIILPGVGYYKTAIDNLKKIKLFDALNFNVLENKKPVLGICLGMQIMTDFGDEGGCNGLGWIEGDTRILNVNDRIPQVGWNSVDILKKNKLLDEQDIKINKNEFFFVHSYHVNLKNNDDALFETTYSNKKFYSGFSKDNIYGVQFHPEKSYDIGIKLISNFIQNV